MAKNDKPLTKRAASIKPEYSPINAPPNPRADEARAAMREYMLPTLAAPQPQIVDDDTAQDESLLARARATWPDCRYMEQATIGTGMAWDAAQQQAVERDGVVVVTWRGPGAAQARPVAAALDTLPMRAE